ncbi:hypothetical protein OSB04_019540 [Centaurea solstitialis]|uniref:Integrase catalytic domain-containing protein n=1 Tax=Centaurea solstitialis TaxID=347529 RepID=A0AA38W308_9ASTR|nr:hypothetical protein OSB04_019540 [Centaurea solstitialis]
MQVRVIRSDNGTELKNSTIKDYLTSVGITHNFSAPRTPQQNGVVERKNRTLVEATRTMLNASGLPLTFWAKVVSTACYTQNRSLVVKRFEKTPYQLLYSKRPNIKFFHVVGANVIEPVGKFDPKGDDVIFIGYAWDSVAYRVYVPITQIVVDKFTEELKIQAEASPNATITEYLDKLFNDWYEDFEESDRTSASSDKASANDDRASASNSGTSVELPGASTFATLSEPINTEPIPDVPIPATTSLATEPSEPNNSTDPIYVPSASTPEPSAVSHEVIHEISINLNL